MRRSAIGLLAAVWLILSAVDTPSARQANALQAASDFLGASNVKSLRVNGWGAVFTLHRSYTPPEPWPRVNLKSYTAQINYDTASMRVQLVRENGLVMPLGGGGPFVGEQRQTQVVSGTNAWNEQPPAAAGGPPRAQPAFGAEVDRMLMLWATPHGFVKGAMANNATTRTVPGGTEVSFTVGGKYKMVGIINPKNQVERVRTWIPDNLFGDMLVETVYQVYREFDGGAVFPSRIVQSQGGFPTLDVNISSVEINPTVDITVPDNVRTAKAPALAVKTETLGKGVYMIRGGPTGTVAVEMNDHIVMIEGGEDEHLVHAYVEEAKKLIPNKPVRYVIASHHHADHNGGLRAYMDLGATIVLHEVHRAFFERMAKSPFTLEPDALSKSKKSPKFLTYPQTRKLTDGTRTIDIYAADENIHSGGMLVTYIPDAKVFTEADAPGTAPNGPLNIAQVPSVAATIRLIKKEKLDPQVVVPFHGDKNTTVAELEKAIVKIPSTN